MTDNEINRALTELAGDCWHECVTVCNKKEHYVECIHCKKRTSPSAGSLLNSPYTKSLDLSLALAEKLGYLVDMFFVKDDAILIQVYRFEGYTHTSVTKHVENSGYQRARRLALATAILKAEKKWVEK